VIAPTRELVVQIVEEAAELGKHAGMRSVAVYGGADMERQARELAAGPLDLVAATPGRLLDFVSRRTLDLSDVEVFIVDEADRMLDMGFIPDVRRIIGRLPPRQSRRTMLFSATLTQDVRRLAASWMADPVVVEIEPEKVAVDTVEQIVYPVASREKFTVLWNLLRKPGHTRVLVFTNRRDRTRHLAYQLHSHGIRCEMISGEVQQNRRLNLLKDFREGRLPVLVATDVAGRGIHVDDVSHVINYDFPYDAEDYVHRIGRTGRAGQAGTAVSFACEDESFVIPEIEKYIGRSLPCRQPPDDLLAPPPIPAVSGRAPESGRPARGPSRGSPRRTASSHRHRRRR
jgi:ATP-dependent RNA helicase RhlB